MYQDRGPDLFGSKGPWEVVDRLSVGVRLGPVMNENLERKELLVLEVYERQSPVKSYCYLR